MCDTYTDTTTSLRSNITHTNIFIPIANKQRSPSTSGELNQLHSFADHLTVAKNHTQPHSPTTSKMANREQDHLTRLAPELQHMIFGYLLPSHEPDKAFETEPSKDEKKGCTHSLDYLAATCKALRDEVNEWALHFLAQHKDITKYKPFKTNRIQQRRDFLRGRHGLLTWADKHCVFCGNKSSRSAILMNGLRCCSKCDKEQWPDKITKVRESLESPT